MLGDDIRVDIFRNIEAQLLAGHCGSLEVMGAYI